MFFVKTENTLRNKINILKKNKKQIGFIPTMGNLHNGHLMLIKKAKQIADIIIVSIYVNPMQFDCKNDFKNYPRTLKNDYLKLKKNNVDLVFSPTNLFSKYNSLKYQTFVEVPKFSSIAEGINRHLHFRGVSTVLTKLFNLIKPNIALFGEKDYQQLQLVHKLVRDLSFDIKIISIPTVRLKNGLALSSRNNNLSKKELKIAPQLYNILKKAKIKLIHSKQTIESIKSEIKKDLLDSGFIPDSIFIRDALNLEKINNNSKKAIILIAVWLGKTRLIDNLKINLF
ncbi:pantoate--beta-alanine ligase [Candidatus Providencia siddallii]|uniref:Pantothenate synthetase n=1 Tax=Candidatus Providencia siddallii TaxID=1715285 RepID=A0ABM9NNH5_9GAMM